MSVKRLAALPAALNRSALIDEQIIDCLERLNGMTLVEHPRRTLPDAFGEHFGSVAASTFFSDFVPRQRRADRFVLTKRPERRATVLSNDGFAELLSNKTLDYANLIEGRSVRGLNDADGRSHKKIPRNSGNCWNVLNFCSFVE